MPTDRRQPTDRGAWVATCLSLLGLIGTLGGSGWGAGLFLAAWIIVLVPRADQCLKLLFRAPWLWLLPALALASTAWSFAPMVTLRAAVQLCMTVGIASLASGFLRPREFASAMSVSLLFGAIVSLAFGRYGIDGLTGATVFVGVFASKNIMALFMSLLALFSLAVLLDRGQPFPLRALAVLSFLLSIPLLLMARSAGALLTTALSVAMLGVVFLFARLPPRERALVLVGSFVLGIPALLLGAALVLDASLGEAIQAFLAGVLGKDATMTGRTVLWQIALAEIDKRPFLGTGYAAFWLPGNLLAEAIWREFFILSRTGFHFHNTILNLAVELGWVGVAALLLTLVRAVPLVLRLALADRGLATAALVAALACLMTRMFAEVDAPHPFAIGTFLLFAVAAYGADYARAARRVPWSLPGVAWPMRQRLPVPERDA